MNIQHTRAFVAVIAAFLLASSAPSTLSAQAVAPTYTLFHPVPRAELRALSSDRPGNGENPFTLDPGHLQFEMGALGFTQVGGRDPGAFGFGGAATKVRVGVRRGTELQFLFDGYSFSKSAGSWDGTTGGFGARAKLNVWGDYSGKTAFALIPALGFARDGQGGWTRNAALTATFAAQLPSAWTLGVTTAASRSAFATAGAVTSGLAAIGAAHVLRGPVSVMFEATAIRANMDRATTEARFGSGFLAALSPSFQLDAGIDLGLTRDADRVRAYAGLVRRF